MEVGEPISYDIVRSAVRPSVVSWVEYGTGGGCTAFLGTLQDGSYYLITGSGERETQTPVVGRPAFIGWYVNGEQVWARKIPSFTTGDEALGMIDDLELIDVGEPPVFPQRPRPQTPTLQLIAAQAEPYLANARLAADVIIDMRPDRLAHVLDTNGASADELQQMLRAIYGWRRVS
jgi:hypothetical protein